MPRQKQRAQWGWAQGLLCRWVGWESVTRTLEERIVENVRVPEQSLLVQDGSHKEGDALGVRGAVSGLRAVAVPGGGLHGRLLRPGLQPSPPAVPFGLVGEEQPVLLVRTAPVAAL